MNTDAERYGGTNVGNLGGVKAEPVPWNNHPYSLNLRLPPLEQSFLSANDGNLRRGRH